LEEKLLDLEGVLLKREEEDEEREAAMRSVLGICTTNHPYFPTMNPTVTPTVTPTTPLPHPYHTPIHP